MGMSAKDLMQQGRNLSSSRWLADGIQAALGQYDLANGFHSRMKAGWQKGSAVMFLIGNCPDQGHQPAAPCLILNKRSMKVRQPGDLCFPGGGISPRKDRILSWLLYFRGSPLRRWGFLPQLATKHQTQIQALRLHLTVALREAWEEMRLNPLKVRFLGFLPLQKLVMYDRNISPMVGWVANQQTFKANWEVQRIVRIPLADLLDNRRYGRFQPMVKTQGEVVAQPLDDEEFPCFIHNDPKGRELLWGATYRMVADFLRIVFKFKAPEMKRLPRVTGYLAPNYHQGSASFPSRGGM